MGETSPFDRALCFSITFHRLGTSRKLADSQFEASGANKRYVRATKMLLKSKETDAIVRADGEFKAYLRDVAVPVPFLRESVYMIPLTRVEDVDAAYEAHLTRRRALVGVLTSAYPRLIEDDRVRFAEEAALAQARGEAPRTLFNPMDYPPAEAVAACYSVESEYVSFMPPEALERVSPELAKRKRLEAEARLTDAAAQIEAALCVALRRLIEHAVERLSGLDDGKPKVFRDSLVENITAFLDSFGERNLTSNGDLDALVQQAKGMLAGVDPAMLRQDPAVRQRVADGFVALQAQVDSWLQERPSRVIELPDDE